MPKNVSGVKCVKCGFRFESGNHGRNIKRKVNGSKFWPKYENHYVNVRDLIVLETFDILCTSCHHLIDRCKIPPDANSIKDIRLESLQEKVVHLEVDEACEVEGIEDNTMSLTMTAKNLKRTFPSQEVEDGVGDSDVNRSFVSPTVSNKKGLKHLKMDTGNNTDVAMIDNHLDKTTAGDIENVCTTKAADDAEKLYECHKFKKQEVESMTTCTTLPHSSSDRASGPLTIIKRLDENGYFYNDKLSFSIINGGALNIKVNKQMLQCWFVRRTFNDDSSKSVLLDIGSVVLLQHVLKFIHTAVTPTFKEFCELMQNKTRGVVNDFLLCLFVYESLRKFREPELKEIVERIRNNEILDPVGSIILLLVKPLKNGLLEAFKFIEESIGVWDDFNILDGDEIQNFSRFQKYYFYFWLYHQKTSQPDVDIVTHVLSSLKPSSSVEADEYFEYVAAETNTLTCIRVHSLILFLQQEVNHEEYLKNVSILRSNLRKKAYSNHFMKLFAQMLYFGKDCLRKNIEPTLLSILIDLAQLFKINQPHKLFGCPLCPNSALDVRVLVELFMKTGSKDHVAYLLRDPTRYLTSSFTKFLQTCQLYSLLIQDDLQLKEFDVYELVIRFAEENCCEDEEEQFRTTQGRLGKLMKAVRFGIMSTDEFKMVNCQPYLRQEYKPLFFYLIHYPGQPTMKELQKFHNPTTNRKLDCLELVSQAGQRQKVI